VQFRHDSGTERVDHAVGPERIAGQWWEGHHRTRDYFDVLTPGGRRFWIFRVVETAKWYLHGIFE
jgi:protein ImuB